MTSQPSPVRTSHGSAHDARALLLARYRTLDEAQQAIIDLESKGIDGDDLALVGPGARAAEHETRERADSRVLSRVTFAVAFGVVGGALLGAILGACIVGIVILVWGGGLTDRAWVFGLLVAWFAAGASLLGAFAGVARSAGFSESAVLGLEGDPYDPGSLAVFGASDDREHRRRLVESTHPSEIVEDSAPETMHPDTFADDETTGSSTGDRVRVS